MDERPTGAVRYYSSIDAKLCIISVDTLRLLIEQPKNKRPADLIAVYNFLILTAKWQPKQYTWADGKTVWCTDEYMHQCLKLSLDRCKDARQNLKKLGLIGEKLAIRSEGGAVEKWVIPIHYKWELEAGTHYPPENQGGSEHNPPEKAPGSMHKGVENTTPRKNQGVVNSVGGESYPVVNPEQRVIHESHEGNGHGLRLKEKEERTHAARAADVKLSTEQKSGVPIGWTAPNGWEGLEALHYEITQMLGERPGRGFQAVMCGLLEPEGAAKGAQDYQGNLHNGYSQDDIREGLRKFSLLDNKSPQALLDHVTGMYRLPQNMRGSAPAQKGKAGPDIPKDAVVISKGRLRRMLLEKEAEGRRDGEDTARKALAEQLGPGKTTIDTQDLVALQSQKMELDAQNEELRRRLQQLEKEKMRAERAGAAIES